MINFLFLCYIALRFEHKQILIHNLVMLDRIETLFKKPCNDLAFTFSSDLRQTFLRFEACLAKQNQICH